MKKALIIATVSGFVPQFEMNNVGILQELGYEVHYASNFKNPHYGSDNHKLKGTGIVCHQVDFVRSPFRLLQNIRVYRQLCHLMWEVPFALIHCHTPMGGVLGRLAAEKIRKMNKKKGKLKWHPPGKSPCGLPARVIYTAHGFHFYKGAPLFNWLIYYPVECLLARITDTLITINAEDYRRAGKFQLRSLDGGKKQVFRVHGVGVDLKAWHGIFADREKNREELKLRKEDFVLLSVGELSKRKNHKVVISALAEIVGNKDRVQMMSQRKEIGNSESRERWRYLIAGDGPMRNNLKKIAHKKGMDGKIALLGYRSDVSKLLAVADCFVFPSKQEGMPVALLEAVAAGIPCIASDIRGNRELMDREWLFPATNKDALQERLLKAKKIIGSRKADECPLVLSDGKKLKVYDISVVSKEMKGIYQFENFSIITERRRPF